MVTADRRVRANANVEALELFKRCRRCVILRFMMVDERWGWSWRTAASWASAKWCSGRCTFCASVDSTDEDDNESIVLTVLMDGLFEL